MAEKKRTTAPLTQEEVADALAEIPEEEFLSRFDDIWTKELDLPEKLGELITLDDYMDNELREMFQSIIAQYLRPVQSAISRIVKGDQSRRTATEGLEALAPILTASATLDYKDITALLGEIERPLKDLDGGKRRLAKKELVALAKAWDELEALVRPAGAAPEREFEGTGPSLSLGTLAKYLEEITASDVRKLRGAGLSTLRELAMAPAEDLASVSGLEAKKAERIHSFAVGALAATTAASAGAGTRQSTRRTRQNAQSGWMRVSIDSDIFKGRLSFEYAALGKYLEPILQALSRLDGSGATPEPARVTPTKPARKPAAKRKAKSPAE